MSKPVAVIYQPAKSAMQSGRCKTDVWVLQYQRDGELAIEPIMGWTSSSDMDSSEVLLSFDSLEAAENYARAQAINYEAVPSKVRQLKPKSYAENFQ